MILQERYHSNKLQIQKECDQLQFEYEKTRENKKIPSDELQSHFEKEIQNRLEKIKLIEFQLEQLHMLPIGSEIKEKEIQAISECKDRGSLE